MTTLTIKVPAQEMTITVDSVDAKDLKHYTEGFLDLMLAPDNEGWVKGLERIDTGASINHSIEVK